MEGLGRGQSSVRAAGARANGSQFLPRKIHFKTVHRHNARATAGAATISTACGTEWQVKLFVPNMLRSV